MLDVCDGMEETQNLGVEGEVRRVRMREA